jgi:hypothetical protein
MSVRQVRIRALRSLDAAPAKAGIAYGAVAFMIGFVLGAIRILAVAPHFGATAAVILEAPIILAASWAVSQSCMTRFGVAATIAAGATMGCAAFATLMAGEIGLSALVFRRSFAGFLEGYRSLPGAIGLAAQIAFAMFPLVQIMRSRSAR